MTDELVVVELLRLPLAVLTRAADHNLTLQRELALVHTADESGVAPARLLWLSQHLDQQYAAFNTAPRQTLQKAIEGDETHVDVRYEVPAHAAVAAAELGAALDEVDDYCRNGDLLTLVTPTEALSFRRWLLGEFIAQIQRGASPTPWSDQLVGTDEDAATTARRGEHRHDHDRRRARPRGRRQSAWRFRQPPRQRRFPPHRRHGRVHASSTRLESACC